MSDIPIQYDVSALESDPTFFRELFHQFDIARESCIQCIVVEYNQEKNTVTVQPLPNRVYDDGEKMAEIERPKFEVPVAKFAIGGFQVLHPVFVGDTGYVIAADRSCRNLEAQNSSVLFRADKEKEVNKGNGTPDDYSLASYTNGFFLPCSWCDQNVPDEDKGKFVISGIGKKDGDKKWQKIALSNDGSIELIVDGRQIRIDSKKIFMESKDSTVTVDNESVSMMMGDKKLSITKDGLKFDGPTDEKISLISDIRYDLTSHQIQARTIKAERSGNLFVNVASPSGWNMIEGGQAVPVE